MIRIHNFIMSDNVSRVIKLNVGCLGHVAYTEEMSSAYKIVYNLKGRDYLRNQCISGKIILKHM